MSGGYNKIYRIENVTKYPMLSGRGQRTIEMAMKKTRNLAGRLGTNGQYQV
jgi:hypothetical protein